MKIRHTGLLLALSVSALNALAGTVSLPTDANLSQEVRDTLANSPLAAGAGSKLISVSYQTHFSGGVFSSTSKLENGALVTPRNNTAAFAQFNTYQVFKGVFSLIAAPGNTYEKLTFMTDTSGSTWPAQQFRLVSRAIYRDSHQTDDRIVTCAKSSEKPAAQYLPELPGRLIRYDCQNNFRTQASGEQGSYAKVGGRFYYSDYLDTMVANMVDPTPGVSSVVYEVSIEFKSPSGAAATTRFSFTSDGSLF